MPNSEEAHRRRGAPFTFDAEKFLHDLTAARQSGAGAFPSFDHGVGDPIRDAIQLDAAQHRLVIVEGNYLLLDQEPWSQLQSLFDETWFIDASLETIRRRVTQRFINRMSKAAAEERVETNDLPNARLVIDRCRDKADRIIASDS